MSDDALLLEVRKPDSEPNPWREHKIYRSPPRDARECDARMIVEIVDPLGISSTIYIGVLTTVGMQHAPNGQPIGKVPVQTQFPLPMDSLAVAQSAWEQCAFGALDARQKAEVAAGPKILAATADTPIPPPPTRNGHHKRFR